MKEFYSFKNALAYQTNCPLCKSFLEIDSLEVNFSTDRRVITWESPNTKLSIDIERETVLEFRVSQSVTNFPSYSIGTGAGPVTYVPSNSRSGYTASGYLMERLIVGCDVCCRYEYVVQVIVQPDNLEQITLLLNSESITLDNKSTTHEIRNIYSFGKTEYTSYTNDILADSKSIQIPLVTMDLENPEKMLDRIKTLVLFS